MTAEASGRSTPSEQRQCRRDVVAARASSETLRDYVQRKGNSCSPCKIQPEHVLARIFDGITFAKAARARCVRHILGKHAAQCSRKCQDIDDTRGNILAMYYSISACDGRQTKQWDARKQGDTLNILFVCVVHCLKPGLNRSLPDQSLSVLSRCQQHQSALVYCF